MEAWLANICEYLWNFSKKKNTVVDCFESQEMFVAMFRVALREKCPQALSDLIL